MIARRRSWASLANSWITLLVTWGCGRSGVGLEGEGSAGARAGFAMGGSFGGGGYGGSGGAGGAKGGCGDGELDPGETCDDGNRVGGDGCSPRCRPEPVA